MKQVAVHRTGKEKKAMTSLRSSMNWKKGKIWEEGIGWRTDGKKLRVARRALQSLREELHDSSFVAQRGMWLPVEQRMRDAGRRATKGSDHVVRQCKAVMEEESCSSRNQADSENEPRGLEETKTWS